LGRTNQPTKRAGEHDTTIKNKRGGKDTNLAWKNQNIPPKLIRNGRIAITETSSPKR